MPVKPCKMGEMVSDIGLDFSDISTEKATVVILCGFMYNWK